MLNEQTRPILANVLKAEQPKADESSGESLAEFVGTLRALDLDKDWLKVDFEDRQLTVKGLPPAVDDIIGPMVNKTVLVKAVKSKNGDFKFVDIELAP